MCGSFVDDFESSPAPHKKAKPQQQGREGARTSTDGAVAQREQDCEVRPSRDERKFSRDTEKALRKSEIPASTESSDGHPSPPLPACGDTVRNGTQKYVGVYTIMLYVCVCVCVWTYGTVDSQLSMGLFQTAGKDGDYEPEDGEEREEEEEFVSGPGESSDNDFSVSSPPRKKTKPAARQTAKTKRSSTTALKTEVTQRGRGRGEREKTVNCKPATLACRTKQGSVSKPTSQPSHTLPSTNNTCTVKSPLPGTPGLGMRRMPRWTPPGNMYM